MKNSTLFFKLTYFVLLIFVFQIQLTAQPGALDPTFDPRIGADQLVTAIAIQNDGKTVVSGNFIKYNGVARNHIARLNIDGSLDPGFNPGTGPNSGARAIAIQMDGKIIISGLFTIYNGIARNRIARLEADGTLDLSFDPGTGANSFINTIEIQDDGKIIIGGGFTVYNGVAINRIARLEPDGSLDLNFDPGTGANEEINAINIQSDGKIIIGGKFSEYNGVSRLRLARLGPDGSLDLSFNPGTGANSTVNTSTIQTDGKIIIGGLFTMYNGVAINRIARIEVDGSLDLSFNPGTGASNSVNAIIIQTDGKISISGNFTNYNGVVRNRIARLNMDGSLDPGFNPGSGANSEVFESSIQTDGKIIIVGSFRIYNGEARNCIARLNISGSLDLSFNPGMVANNEVLASNIQSDGKIIIGGSFTSSHGISRNRISRLEVDGNLDLGFNPGTGANNTIYSINILDNGKIIIGGQFTNYNGVTVNRISRLETDGSLDLSFNSGGTGANNHVFASNIQSDGKIIIGGFFTAYNGVTINRIARLETDGSLDLSFNPGAGPNHFVEALAFQNDNKIIIVGTFQEYDGVSRNRVARLDVDGSLDLSFNPGTGANGDIYTISIQDDGKIIIAGMFTEYNGVARNRIARLEADGSLDLSFNPGSGANGVVNSTNIQVDGKIIVAGSFTAFNGSTRGRIARLKIDGSVDPTFSTSLGAENSIHTTFIQSDGKIFIGGIFTSYNGNGINRIARLIGYTDSDGDGISNEDDNCPGNANAEQADADGDDIGDLCDDCPEDPNNTDTDEDGIPDCIDNCPNIYNEDQADTDNDGIGDTCDNCTSESNEDQVDSDCDGVGDACDVCPGGDDTGPCNASSLPPLNELPSYWLCSNNNNSDKILICHQGSTICVSESAANTHLSHGDFLGPCSACPQYSHAPISNAEPDVDKMPLFELSPNPATDQITARLIGDVVEGQLIICDQLGREVFIRQLNMEDSFIHMDLDENRFPGGMYYISIMTDGNVQTKRFVIEK